jgi:hypothetical protein
LEIPYCSGKETASDEIEEASGDDQEELKFGRCATPKQRLELSMESGTGSLLINQISDETSGNQSDHDWKRNRGRRSRKGYASDKNNCFETFSENGDERNHEHHIPLSPPLSCCPPTDSSKWSLFHSFGKLNTPLLLHLGHAKEGSTKYSDDAGSEDSKGSFPIVLGITPFVLSKTYKAVRRLASMA